MIQIKKRITGELLFECDKGSIKLAVEVAVETKANLRGADLSSANLSSADLSSANLSSANLRGADLSSANLSSADLSSANLSSANLSSANLSSADLSSANLSSANLRGADLWGADLSGAKNILDPIEHMKKNFLTDATGWIVYKAIGATQYPSPSHWKIEQGSFLSEVVNPLPTCDCACGVNFGTKKWCRENYPQSDVWKCRIHWIDSCSIVVPYNTDGKCRCGRLELLEIVK